MCRLCLTDEAKSTFLLDKPWKKITSTADACDVITIGAISKSKVNTKFLWRWQYS